MHIVLMYCSLSMSYIHEYFIVSGFASLFTSTCPVYRSLSRVQRVYLSQSSSFVLIRLSHQRLQLNQYHPGIKIPKKVEHSHTYQWVEQKMLILASDNTIPILEHSITFSCHRTAPNHQGSHHFWLTTTTPIYEAKLHANVNEPSIN